MQKIHIQVLCLCSCIHVQTLVFDSLFIAKIWVRLDIRKEDLPKYEDELELKIAKADLEELQRDAVEAMETQLKRFVWVKKSVLSAYTIWEPLGKRIDAYGQSTNTEPEAFV